MYQSYIETKNEENPWKLRNKRHCQGIWSRS